MATTTIPLDSWSESDRQAIREQMDRILHSGPFLQSRRRQRLLKYIVDETLAGRSERLKGYTLARDVFDRPETFDGNLDPIVRMEASRLRDRLREYYETDGQSDPIRIELPKGAYTPHIEFRQPAVAARHTSAPHAASHLPIAATAVALVLALGAAGAWLSSIHWAPAQREAVIASELGAPDGPSIAVLPFANLSGDPNQDYFSDGLTDDILTELSRARDLNVIARNTTFQYKGKAVDAMKLGRELKARYLLEGSIQRTGDRLRVTAQLIDTKTGTHIWADRYDREMADVLLVQDEIVSEIFANVAGGYGVIERVESKPTARKSPNEVQAYDLVLRAHQVMQWEWNRENFHLARDFLRQAITLDPANARAHREATWLALIGSVFRYDDQPMPASEITADATKTIELDPSDARARMVAASAYFFNKQLDLFEHEADKAFTLAPHDAEILATLGCLFAKSGNWQRGVPLLTRAYALNPDAAAGWYQSTLAINYYLKGDYAQALALMQQDPDKAPYTLNYWIPIYGQLGRKLDARESWLRLLEDERSGTVDRFEAWYHKWNFRDEDIAKLMDGVYKSGVLETEAKASAPISSSGN